MTPKVILHFIQNVCLYNAGFHIKFDKIRFLKKQGQKMFIRMKIGCDH